MTDLRGKVVASNVYFSLSTRKSVERDRKMVRVLLVGMKIADTNVRVSQRIAVPTLRLGSHLRSLMVRSRGSKGAGTSTMGPSMAWEIEFSA